jgi:valyl-tRNA synthetase
MTIDKTYQPAAVEGRIYAAWQDAGAFRAGRPERAKAAPYCIVIPPPNVTGSLHMGHALNNTLQDILCRFERMRGKDVLWQPGTDHAGIATQAVVERQLMERQQPGSREMGREAFIKRVWEWKAESGGAILSQLKRLGASCDWSRERFTMDEGLSRAVAKVFVELYRSGLIYKDKRLVNWDPKLKTAISDLEVQQVETKGSLWYIKYPVEGSDELIVVATTRPETMLGDTAIAVHPENERLKHLIGKMAILPLVGRRIPIIGDEYADPEKGSGAVKITPAHDFNDFEVGKRHNLPLVNVFDVEGRLDLRDNAAFLHEVPPSSMLDETLSLHGMDRFAARKRIVELLEARGLLEKIEPTTHTVPHGDRSGAVIEPFLTDQWYVDAKTLAQPAIEAVRTGRTVFVPGQWEATFFNWMENIQPWCISRQIWWGHQIPAWYGPDGKIFVAETEDDAVADALAHYTDIEEITVEDGHDIAADPERTKRFANEYLHRDDDVLDTWFSSALWPFSTLGWPDETPDLKRFYPTSVLVTGFDIIFFWVARMMMMGLHFMKEVPFPIVYIHALVRDASGAKMSKSKGNVIDPLQLIDEYGADALRFTLAAMAAQGRDIKLSSERVAGYRNFATKLWNAARFLEFNGVERVEGFVPNALNEPLNRWIARTISTTIQNTTTAIEQYRFNDAAEHVYRFVWNNFCDQYIEASKPLMTGPDGPDKVETRAMATWVLDEILKLLHPFMPFITEELWRVTGAAEANSGGPLALASWPQAFEVADDVEMEPVFDVVTELRAIRTTYNLPFREILSANLTSFDTMTTSVLSSSASSISRMANTVVFVDGTQRAAPNWESGTIQVTLPSDGMAPSSFTPGAAVVNSPVSDGVMFIALPTSFDANAERARLAKEMAKCDADIARVDAKLGNPNFVARAPEDVVEEEKEKRDEAQARKSKIAEALERLKGAA